MSELALQLIEKEKRERTGILDLGNCGLSDIPEEVYELTWLEELRMDNSSFSQNRGPESQMNHLKIAELPRALGFLSELHTLTLNGHYSRKKALNCNVLSALVNLETLVVHACQFYNLDFLYSLSKLKDLHLTDAKIQDILPVKELKQLQALILSNNEIQNINPIKELEGLTTLVLQFNHIEDITPIQELKQLTTLVLGDNFIQDITPIKKLKQLTIIDLGINPIQDITPIEGLKNLNTLELRYCSIQDIKPLKKHERLIYLDLEYNDIQDISTIGDIKQLETLRLGNNNIRNISHIRELKRLKTLSLSNNKVCDISSISELKELETLFLDRNNIQNIEPIHELKRLKTLRLNYNKIQDIGPAVHLLKQGQKISLNHYQHNISLEGNPLTNPHKSIAQEGREAVLEWFEQVDEYGIAPFFEGKVMVLGQGDAGKTTFVNLQLNPDFKVTPGKSASTLGVSVHKGRSFPNLAAPDTPIKAHLWDFGGQDIQKMLHQFFITESCLYVIISDKRAENARFDYWFQIIDLLGPKSEVLVLENPKNTQSANEGFAKKKYQELFDQLNIESLEVNLLHTRSKDKTKWRVVNETLQEKLSELEIVTRPVPKKWALVRTALEGLKQTHISKDYYYSLCEEKPIELPRRHADLCLFYLHELGELVYFDDQELCTHIFLDHNWLTKGMYYILSDTRIEKNKGRFTRNQAYKAWDTHGYNEQEKSMLLSLLLKDRFDICYKLGNRESYITPLLLPTDKPEKWTLLTHLYFRYQYGFMPHGMFSRLMVKLHERIEGEQRWKTGMWLINDYEGTRITAEVQSINDPKDNQRVIDIKINGTKEGCKELLNFIRNGLNQLHSEFENIKLTEKVGCNCNNCRQRMQEGEKPTFYDYQRLLAKVQNKSYSVDCEHSGYADINIGQVLSDVVIENAAEDNNDSRLLHFLKEMNMSINQIKNENKVEMSDFGKSHAESNASAEAKATNQIHIEIQNIIGETEALKEDIEDERKLLQRTIDNDEIDVAIRDVEKAEEAIRAIETAQQDDATPSAKSKNRFRRFIEDLSDEESTLHKTLKVLKQGKKYAKGLVKGYNKIANSIGQSPLGEAAMQVIEAI